MKLGELIRKLGALKSAMPIRFAFGGLKPAYIDSWRGDYAQLALGFDVDNKASEDMTVGDLLKLCKEAEGKTFVGYKGGNFKMDKNTEVYVDNYGECSMTVITAITATSYAVLIHTANEEDLQEKSAIIFDIKEKLDSLKDY